MLVVVRKISIFLLVLLAININADEIKKVDFGWSSGIVRFSPDGQSQTNMDIDLLHFSWLLNNKYIISFDILNLGSYNGSYNGSYYDKKKYVGILPLKLSYIPLTFSFPYYSYPLHISFYGKIGWQWREHENSWQLKEGFFPSVGSQLFSQYKKPESFTPYYNFYSFFVDYDFSYGLKYGFATDVTPAILGIGIVIIVFAAGRSSPGGF